MYLLIFIILTLLTILENMSRDDCRWPSRRLNTAIYVSYVAHATMVHMVWSLLSSSYPLLTAYTILKGLHSLVLNRQHNRACINNLALNNPQTYLNKYIIIYMCVKEYKWSEARCDS